jgi:hypothetical protein
MFAKKSFHILFKIIKESALGHKQTLFSSTSFKSYFIYEGLSLHCAGVIIKRGPRGGCLKWCLVVANL